MKDSQRAKTKGKKTNHAEKMKGAEEGKCQPNFPSAKGDEKKQYKFSCKSKSRECYLG
jgi:hypothetical protein